MKRTTKQYIIVALICIIVMGGAAVFTSILITGQVKEKYTILLEEARQELIDNKRTVFVAEVDIMAGDYITSEKVKKSMYFLLSRHKRISLQKTSVRLRLLILWPKLRY
jgi:Flp pilus assembly protein CpaB